MIATSMICLAILLIACADNGDDTEEAADETPEDEPEDGNEETLEEYPVDEIELVAGTNPGGGFDTQIRLVAPYLEKHLPGNPSVVIVNEPGAGHIIAHENTYVAEPDGSRLQYWEPGQILLSRLEGGTDIRVTEPTPIGQITSYPELFYVPASLDVHSMDDLKDLADEEGIRLGTTGVSFATATAAIVFEAFDIGRDSVRTVLHDGGSENRTALLRGDVDLNVGSPENVLDDIADGELRPILITGERPAEGELGYEELQDTPTAEEAGHPELMQGLYARRIVGGPPGMSQELVDMLETALVQALEDPDLIAEAESTGAMTPEPLSAVETAAQIQASEAIFDQYEDALRLYMEE